MVVVICFESPIILASFLQLIQPQIIYNLITVMEFSAMFTSQVNIFLRSKYCRRPIAVMGVVDHFGH